MRRIIIIGLTVIILGVIGAAVSGVFNKESAKAPDTTEVTSEPSPLGKAAEAKTEVVAEGLEIPWEAAFLPDGRIFITERSGDIRIIKDNKLEEKPYLTVQTVAGGEGGLQGLALDPDFASNHFVYIYVSSGTGDNLINRVVRYRDIDTTLVEPKTIVDNIPGNNIHNGGRLAFGPDGKLYVTTGDSQEPSLAQDRNSLAGKILRLNADGSRPADNPFGNLVWSYGHRNPQGLAWDGQGTLYSTEHGPSGELGLCCRDELNKIDKGGNYGWPTVSGDQKRNGLISPLLHSGNGKAWAPGGLAIGADNRLYIPMLRDMHLRAVTIQNGSVTADEELYKEAFGRLRTIVRGRDGKLYLTTSNRDGRGKANPGDDKLIRLTVP